MMLMGTPSNQAMIGIRIPLKIDRPVSQTYMHRLFGGASMQAKCQSGNFQDRCSGTLDKNSATPGITC